MSPFTGGEAMLSGLDLIRDSAEEWSLTEALRVILFTCNTLSTNCKACLIGLQLSGGGRKEAPSWWSHDIQLLSDGLCFWDFLEDNLGDGGCKQVLRVSSIGCKNHYGAEQDGLMQWLPERWNDGSVSHVRCCHWFVDILPAINDMYSGLSMTRSVVC